MASKPRLGLLAAVLVSSILFAFSQAAPTTEALNCDELAKWIDGRVSDHFAASHAAAPSLVDDATFLRRAYLDLVGTIPVVAEFREFLADDAQDKRERLIDRLLDDPRCATHLARTFRRILVPDANPEDPVTRDQVGGLETWLANRFVEQASYDEIARQLVTTWPVNQGPPNTPREQTESPTGPANYLQLVGRDPPTATGSISRVFLGVRIECAQCHDHPFVDWKQDDFWGLAAFFAGTTSESRTTGDDNTDKTSVAAITPPDIGRTFQAGFLWDGNEDAVEIPDGTSPQDVFADWLTSAQNPHFSATAVNRTWQLLCGRGLTYSVDDLDFATEAERAVVLDDLADLFAAHDFDLRWLIAGICKSQAYQFASEDAESTLVGVRPLKVLSPEQVFDALETALALPISSIDEGPRYNGERSRIVARLSEAVGTTPDEFRGGIPQMLLLMNGNLTADATSLERSRTLRAVLEAPFLDVREKLETLYISTLTRLPTASETEFLLAYIEQADHDPGKAYSEVLWSLINSPEFMFLR